MAKLNWRHLIDYPKTAPDVLFWLRDEGAEFPIFGRWDFDEDCIWDSNDFGYTGHVVGWAKINRPEPLQ